MAILNNLLREHEAEFIEKRIDEKLLDKEFRSLTVQDLTEISFQLLNTENPNRLMPEGFLPLMALRILMIRAVEKNIDLF